MILLDEIEKAHPDVFNILLQLMDDGRLTDGQGRTVDFTNTVVIMTSNLGAGGDEAEVMAAVRNHFKPEFLNRVDEIVVFHRLSEADIERIVDIQVEQLADRLAARGLGLELTEAARQWIAKTGYDPDFGARPLKRVLQREVADPIALELLKGDVPGRRHDRRRRQARRRPRVRQRRHRRDRHLRRSAPTSTATTSGTFEWDAPGVVTECEPGRIFVRSPVPCGGRRITAGVSSSRRAPRAPR